MASVLAYQLGLMLEEWGDVDRAKAAYKQAVDADHSDYGLAAADRLRKLG